jgi:hypothetical protein
MTTEATPREVGSHAGLGLAPEREAFARWCRENGHGELDDMLTPLDRSLRALMWPVWQGAVAAERERLLGAMLSTPNLMHACDALGVPANVEYCDLLRRALYRA